MDEQEVQAVVDAALEKAEQERQTKAAAEKAEQEKIDAAVADAKKRWEEDLPAINSAGIDAKVIKDEADNEFATAGEFFQAWKDYCQSIGRDHHGTAQTFGRDLRAAVPGLKVRQPRMGSGRLRWYDGIALAHSADDGMIP